MSKGRFGPRTLVVILLAVLFGIALYLRVAIPYDQVFVGDRVKFTTNDAYYYLRQIDSLMHNFPHLISFDPYLNYPTGSPTGSMNFFVYLLGGIIWLISLGSPNAHLVDTISAFFPAVLGALTVIPVYFVGKALFARMAGTVAAALIAILPGELMARTILGSTDRDALEIMLTTLMMLFLILAIKGAREKQLTFRHLNLKNPSILTGPIIYSLLSGVLLGLCLLTWRGTFLFVLVILVYVVIQSILDHLKNEASDPMIFVGIITFLTALVIFWVVSHNKLYSVVMSLSLILLPIMSGLAWLLKHRKIKAYYYPLTVIGMGLFGLGILYAVSPALFKSILDQFSVFTTTQSDINISEMKPILFPADYFTLSVIWANYTTGLFLSLVSLCVLIYLSFKRSDTSHVLMITWSLITLGATLVLRRLAPFFAINVALLTGYMSIILYYGIQFVFSHSTGRSVPRNATRKQIMRAQKKYKTGPLKRGDFQIASGINVVVAMTVIFFLVFFPNFKLAATTAKLAASFTPNEAWYYSLSWLRDNTPEPFGDASSYYASYQKPFYYPETAYGVTAWWDYGYWITRIGHRLPNCNPGGGKRELVAKLFMAQDEILVDEITEKLNSKYIITDEATATTKFDAVSTYAGIGNERFLDVYYRPSMGKMEPVTYYYPDYYKSLIVRLHFFDGQKVTSTNTSVISYAEKLNPEGIGYKEILSTQLFPTFDEARAYVSNQSSGNYRIASPDPLLTPVSLDSLDHYKLVHNYTLVYPFNQVWQTMPGTPFPTMGVKIFEYSK